jgi:hypothetical protein
LRVWGIAQRALPGLVIGAILGRMPWLEPNAFSRPGPAQASGVSKAQPLMGGRLGRAVAFPLSPGEGLQRKGTSLRLLRGTIVFILRSFQRGKGRGGEPLPPHFWNVSDQYLQNSMTHPGGPLFVAG